MADMLLYKKLIAAMPFHDKACGFICGKNELMNWPKHDLFQLYHDTKPLYKEMSHFIPEINNEYIKQSVTIGAANLYHAISHSYIYGNNNALSLMKLLKGTFYILQAKHRLETGNYVKSRTELSTKLSGLDKEIIDLSNNRKMLACKSNIEIDQCYSILINWCQNILHTYQ
ncbi:hypothetical protein [Paenibacillus sp. DMB20]|uniref:hypothetical protein n=1 Tax=Paenibacillus sp. DMB20 TaxID=1642570 RepID=UPI00069C1A09|nr:hypothetical protein [Paenibacillus sp. DMB20]